MKKLISHFFSERGITLVEILTSIVILSIIILSLLPMFVQSSRSNHYSKTMMEATYVAEKNLEDLYHLSTTSTFPNGSLMLESEKGYTAETKDCPIGNCYDKEADGYYVFIQLKEASGNTGLISGIVTVYSDKLKTKKEAQMEMLLNWEMK